MKLIIIDTKLKVMRVLLNLCFWSLILLGPCYLLFDYFEDNEEVSALFFLLMLALTGFALVFLFIAATLRVVYRDKEAILNQNGLLVNSRLYSLKKIVVNKWKGEERKLGHFIHCDGQVFFVEKADKEDLILRCDMEWDCPLEEMSKDYDFYFGFITFSDFDFLSSFN